MASIFLKTITNDSDSDSKNIAKSIIEVSDSVQEAIDNEGEDKRVDTLEK